MHDQTWTTGTPTSFRREGHIRNQEIAREKGHLLPQNSLKPSKPGHFRLLDMLSAESKKALQAIK